MTVANSNVVDEETPLLTSPVEASKKRQASPLPKLQITIVLLLQLCEPITSQSIYPYINQLVSELDVTGGDERKVGYYAGLIDVLDDRHQASAYQSFPSSPLVKILICWIFSRCLCGLLNGNIGVMKSVMGELTDSSNRAEGFALIPVVWAVGATAGPLLGGTLSNPHERFPTVFRNEFWKEYPYFLPCLVASSFSFVTIGITSVFFKETVPKSKLVASPCSETPILGAFDEDAPLPLRKVMVWPVIISVANYSALAFLEIMLGALLPLFFAMPIEIGGLGFSPPTIGYLWGGYGAAAGIFNILCFAKLIRRFGEKRVFFFGMTIITPIYILMPIMSVCARTWGVGPLVWSLVLFELFLMVVMDISYGAIFMFVTASAPNKRSLGATNGLSQMTVSIARAIGPALSTSLFSYSVQHNILGGYGVYLLMIILSLLALVIATFLPAHVWDSDKSDDRK
ncbi:hypothetical protein D9756_003044 [Leucocoprinus leucothites]|uniref:Major facilitator superfamily (MFS) profile domain-containing protein n=1 Tax=Leucocoprinus leucothites TaxID=201217 RepID=A0A8H5G7E1_9AGAR|nr:hypothetical protein D9756_003044 [Leucoagaricus leucothites]